VGPIGKEEGRGKRRGTYKDYKGKFRSESGSQMGGLASIDLCGGCESNQKTIPLSPLGRRTPNGWEAGTQEGKYELSMGTVK